jgi:hypothetical protein
MAFNLALGDGIVVLLACKALEISLRLAFSKPIKSQLFGLLLAKSFDFNKSFSSFPRKQHVCEKTRVTVSENVSPPDKVQSQGVSLARLGGFPPPWEWR